MAITRGIGRDKYIYNVRSPFTNSISDNDATIRASSPPYSARDFDCWRIYLYEEGLLTDALDDLITSLQDEIYDLALRSEGHWTNRAGVMTIYKDMPPKYKEIWDAFVVWIENNKPCGEIIIPFFDTVFSGTPLTGYKPLSVTFTDASSGRDATKDLVLPTSWYWNFGDFNNAGNLSISQNPTHNFVDEGTFTVSLTAAGDSQSDIETKIAYITVLRYFAPSAAFTSDVISGAAPLTVNFTDQSTGDVTSWRWNFSDGISLQQNPTNIFSQSGTYTVSLTATGPSGSDVEIKQNYITAVDLTVTADFSASTTSGGAPLDVQFTNLSTGATSYRWNFGDGSIINTETNPAHIFSDIGTFSVTLTASGPGGDDIETKTNLITTSYSPTGGIEYIDAIEITSTYNNAQSITVRNSNTICSLWTGDNDSNPTIRSFSIDNDYNITQTPVDTLQLAAVTMRDGGLIHVKDDIIMCLTGNPTAQEYAYSFACDSSGNIGSIIDSLLISLASNSGYRHNVVNPHPGIFLSRPPQGAGGYTTWSFACDDTGQIGAAYIDRMNNTVNGLHKHDAQTGNYLVSIDSSTVQAYIYTYSCDSAGDLPAANIDSWGPLTVIDAYSWIYKVTDTIFAIGTRETAGACMIRTFSIDGSGNINKSWINTKQINTATGSNYRFQKIRNDIFLTAHQESGVNHRLQTWDIDDSGIITGPIRSANNPAGDDQINGHDIQYLGNNVWIFSSLKSSTPNELRIRTIRIT